MTQKLCKYKNCRHESRIIPEGEEVRVSNTYYHKDCNNERISINKIIDVWKQSVDAHPIDKEIRRVINNIVGGYDIRPQQLLFHLIWCINNGWHLKHVNGLYYVAKCDGAAEDWKKRNTVKIDESVFVAKEQPTEKPFDYTPPKSGFNKIFRSAT